MIEVSRLSSSLASDADLSGKVRILGVGGAGSNVLDRIILDGFDKSVLYAANTDAQSLTASVAGNKVQLGKETTRGLGAGGDPELGHAAADEAAEQLRETVSGSAITFLCAGLGGGTGSGAAPLIAQLAREQGSLVIAFVTMPFSFEGRRRRSQADEALEQLRQCADLVICFENDRMGETSTPKAGVQSAFIAADTVLSQSVRNLAQVFQKSGLLRIHFDDLANVIRGAHEQCIFGYGEAEGDTRSHDAVARALKSPLMERGKLLEQSPAIVVSVSGGTSMTLQEVEALMADLNKFVEDSTLIHLGISTDPRMGEKMSVMILGGLGKPAASVREIEQPILHAAPVPVVPVPVVPVPVAPVLVHEEVESEVPAEQVSAHEPTIAAELESQIVQEPELTIPEIPAAHAAILTPEPQPDPPVTRRLRPTSAPAPGGNRPPIPGATQPALPKKVEAYQETLPFEPVSRGRFDKSEPTIIDGEDLDVPTYLRRNIRVK